MSTHPNFFAQPQPFKRYADVVLHTPPGFTYLHQGYFGRVFVSTNGTTVLKVFMDSDVEGQRKEYNILQLLSACAPDYAPGPVKFTRVNVGGFEYPAIQMPNAGNAMNVLGNIYQSSLPQDQQLPALTVEELALCMLQSIHCVLLVNDRLQMKDVHRGNLCVQWRGPEIHLRFIDVGMWSIEGGGIVNNAYTLFWGMKDPVERLWFYILKPYAQNNSPLALELQQILQQGITKFQKGKLSRLNVYAELVQLAEDIKKTFYKHAECSRDYYIRVETLLESIYLANHMALLQFSPQPHQKPQQCKH